MDQRELQFELLDSAPNATLFFITVLQKCGAALWKRDTTEEEKAQALQLVCMHVQQKYPEVTEEAIRRVWVNLQHAYLDSQIPCRYRKKLNFMIGSYPVPSVESCTIIISQSEELARMTLKLMPKKVPRNAKKDVGVQTDPEEPFSFRMLTDEEQRQLERTILQRARETIEEYSRANNLPMPF
uniref:Importin N-terminal domain-containing protein n=1 Tax=Steinernema glaseri TaxID=37863 RepID=A0A1I7ZM88_9BILA